MRLVRAALIGGLIPFQDTFHFASDDEFFVRRNDEHLHARVRGADGGFRSAGGVVLVPVEHDAELVEIRANRLAQFGAVLANAGGENDRIGAITPGVRSDQEILDKNKMMMALT